MNEEFLLKLQFFAAACVATVLKFCRSDQKHSLRTVIYELSLIVVFALYVAPWAAEFWSLSEKSCYLVALAGNYFASKIIGHCDEIITAWAKRLKGGENQ